MQWAQSWMEENQIEFSTGFPYLQYGKSHWNVENQTETVLQ